MAEIGGVITAMVTPFAEDRSVDEAAARKLARHLIDNGSHGLVLSGTTGESPTLDDEEKLSLLRAVRAVTPYYNKPNFRGIKAHYERVANAAGIPVVLYNIPSRVVVNLSSEQLAELAQIENVVAVKQANDDELRPIDGLRVLAGNDGTFLPTLEMREPGGVLVASHLVGPELREIYDAVQAGDLDRAREINLKLQPIYEMISHVNPIPVKAALELLGICSCRARLPIVEATEQERDEIREVLETQGLLTGSAA